MVVPCLLIVTAVQGRSDVARAQDPSECPPLSAKVFALWAPLLIALLWSPEPLQLPPGLIPVSPGSVWISFLS